MTRVPHVRIVVAASLLAVLGYLGFSIWVFGWTEDAALRGDVVGTWKSFATLAFGFWIGSSSAGKAKDGEPAPVAVVNGPDSPVPVEAQA
ncbi:hypothetical protein [Novosphingobium sp. ES2-1]|uniref:hypothetical protein n=1 Tax=Novosphingobium sp. ES2-1 TaxID=2780074 RepID=UPI0018806E36|nr:hypothetical protein [Novosphingobium sp. ES2-1]QOV92579.1 hypothetical protein IM701_07635 [Novosphingobium sp. ES2-1]